MELAYLLVSCRHGKLGIASAALRKYPEIDELHEVYGRYNVIAKVVCNDKAELKSFVTNKLQITEGIRSVEILVASDIESE